MICKALHAGRANVCFTRIQAEGEGWEPVNITKTYLYNFDPLKPHFYIVKLGFTGVYISFLISRRGGSNEYPQSMF